MPQPRAQPSVDCSLAKEVATGAVVCVLGPFILLWVLCEKAVYHGKSKYDTYKAKRGRALERKRDAQDLEEYIRNIPQPLPQPRKRSLSNLPATMPLSTCSLLTKLPLETRLEIYFYALGGNLIHIVRKGKNLGHVRCKLMHQTDFTRSCRPAALRTSPELTSGVLAFTSNGNLALLRACRQIYIEAVHILYASNTFDFDHQDMFLYFSSGILPQRLAAIKHLHLNLDIENVKKPQLGSKEQRNAWCQLWQIVAKSMSSLTHLHIRLIGEHAAKHPVLDRTWWTAPILEVRGLKEFEIEYVAPGNNRNAFGQGVGQMTELWVEEIRRIVCLEPRATTEGLGGPTSNRFFLEP